MRLEQLKEILSEASQVFVLTDENVAQYWLPELEHWLGCEQAVEIIVKPGEKYKTLRTAQKVWRALLRHNADRDAILVNMGGGTVTDLGGFVASCYQRGIRFVNVPTTLLAMVDAAIGGKNGINFGNCKNQIGTFTEPLEVMVNPICLSTLPERELRTTAMLPVLPAEFYSFLQTSFCNREPFLLQKEIFRHHVSNFQLFNIQI